MQNVCQLSVAVIIAPGMAFWQRIGTESAPTGRYMIFCLFCAVFIMLIREFLFIFAKNNQCYEKNIFPFTHRSGFSHDRICPKGL